MKFFLILSASLAVVSKAVNLQCQKYGSYSSGCMKNFLSQPGIKSKADLDKVASDQNTSEILKIIDTASNYVGQPCEVKLTYLHEVLGSVKEKLSKKLVSAPKTNLKNSAANSKLKIIRQNNPNILNSMSTTMNSSFKRVLQIPDLIKLQNTTPNQKLSQADLQASLISWISKKNYECFGTGNVKAAILNQKTLYTIKGGQFESYLKKAYGWKTQLKTKTNNDMKLQVLDPFTQEWSYKFGFLWFEYKQKSFQCFNPTNSTVYGKGKIYSIKDNMFKVVIAGGNSISLSTGACSRIESNTQFPFKNQNIAWKGYQVGSGVYNVDSMICWN